MGRYVNPGNQAFALTVGPNYVDKTGLIELINQRIDGNGRRLVCVSRPRRFGKTFATKMLAAYYDCSCRSDDQFAGMKISQSAEYATHLNQYNVIYLDVSGFTSAARKNGDSLREVPGRIEKAIRQELIAMMPDSPTDITLEDAMISFVTQSDGKRFVFVIDEWDVMIREAKDDEEAQERYLNLLRSWFKNENFTPNVVAAAYMTGILPIKKDGSQSAISDFAELSILEPDAFAEYFGFTEKEVEEICKKNHLDFDTVKQWYDGYTVGDIQSIYNPYSVMEAVERHRIRSYWRKSSIAEPLKLYVDMNQDGLQDDIIALISGQRVEVNTGTFQNDFETFKTRDDVLTLLIHLGYLTYEEEGDERVFAHIPNEEIRGEFDAILRQTNHQRLIELVRASDQLLKDTLNGNEEAVAKAVKTVHETSFAPVFYNNEQSLRYTVKMAYISCVDQYARVEELPSGHGCADIAYLPRRNSPLPAMVIELKWNKGEESAIAQIRDRNYQNLPAELVGDVILVGISYDEVTKQHTCQIERIKI